MAPRIAIVDTMVLAALIQPGDTHPSAPAYRQRIGDRPVVISSVTLAELRYGALKANSGELHRRGLERDLAQFLVVQPGGSDWDGDRWIAATALRLDAVLEGDDGIFSNVPNLTVV